VCTRPWFRSHGPGNTAGRGFRYNLGRNRGATAVLRPIKAPTANSAALVRVERLELPRLAAPEPKSGVSTNFTIPAHRTATKILNSEAFRSARLYITRFSARKGKMTVFARPYSRFQRFILPSLSSPPACMPVAGISERTAESRRCAAFRAIYQKAMRSQHGSLSQIALHIQAGLFITKPCKRYITLATAGSRMITSNHPQASACDANSGSRISSSQAPP
jgi:hypothetical protein